MDILRINQLAASVIIGVHDWEKLQPQPLLFDIEFTVDTVAAAQTDDLQYSLNYQAVSEQLLARLEAARFELLEALLANVADWLFSDFPCKTLSVTVFKPNAITQAQSVSLTTTRQ